MPWSTHTRKGQATPRVASLISIVYDVEYTIALCTILLGIRRGGLKVPFFLRKKRLLWDFQNRQHPKIKSYPKKTFIQSAKDIDYILRSRYIVNM